MTREEAINKVREMNLPKETKEILEALAPELAESEDERIKARLIEYFQGFLEGYEDCYKDGGCVKWEGLDVKSILAWLEKQKEQKPISTEDMPYITDEHFYEREPADSFKYKLAEYMTKNCTKKEGPYGYTYGISAESILKMAEEELLKRGVVQKPAEWSEEDEKIVESLISLIETISEYYFSDETRNGYVDWLKSLRPRPSWKPSEEQIYSLGTVVKGYDECTVGSVGYNLKEMYEQLKKLM